MRELSRLFLDRHPGISTALATGKIEGVPFRVLDGDILPGDTYIAERNTGLRLLTCRQNNKDRGWVVPVGPEYLYDTGECFRIELLIEE